MESEYSLITPMKERRLEMRAIERGWPISDEQRVHIVDRLVLIAVGRVGDASPRDRIRATECLAKLDALNIQREAMDKTKRLELHVLPPAYEQMTDQANEQMTDQANEQMVSYLQTVALRDAT